jgi:hypothetical protein
MSYANPQRQVISNAPAFQNLQQSITSAVSAVAGAVIKRADQEREDQEKKELREFKEYKELFAASTGASQDFTEATLKLQNESKLRVDLTSDATAGKELIFGETMQIKPGSDPKRIAKSQQVIAEVNAYPTVVTKGLALLTGTIETTKTGMTENRMSSLITQNPTDNNKALILVSTGNPDSGNIRVDRSTGWNNPTYVIEAMDPTTKKIVTGRYLHSDLVKADAFGGIMQLVPDPNVSLESTKKRTPGVFSVVKTTGKKGETIEETDGSVLPQFLDLANAKPDPSTQTTVESLDGKTLLKKGIVVATVNKEAIAKSPEFIASTDAIADGILTNFNEAYSLNNDIMVKALGKDAALTKPADGITDEWKNKFRENWKAYTLKNIPDTQPIKNEAGEFVTETIKAEKAKGGGGSGGAGGSGKTNTREEQIAANLSIANDGTAGDIVNPLNKNQKFVKDAEGKWVEYVKESPGAGFAAEWTEKRGKSREWKTIDGLKQAHPELFRNLAKPGLPRKK